MKIVLCCFLGILLAVFMFLFDSLLNSGRLPDGEDCVGLVKWGMCIGLLMRAFMWLCSYT